jgi:DNA helicase IV
LSSGEAARREQAYISLLYQRLDESREQASARVTALLQSRSSTHQGRTERDAAHAMQEEKLARLNAAENGLCFGRLDLLDEDEPLYIGRLGLFDGSEDHKPLLIDWRAPAARPFYLATAVSPEGVKRRRHIRTRHRTVVDIHDEVLDLGAEDGAHDGITGEAALLAALNESRTGQMTDIVATIQAEQDRIIRSPHRGVLVVQGGPGTGKTAVALHRAAFLLYTHREQIARRVVLVIGPNPTFLRYIGSVLPSLGESSVLLSTVGGLYPGVTADLTEPPETAEVKGRITMAGVVAAAVRDRQWVPGDVLEVTYERKVLRLDRQTCERVRELARGSGLPHNQARPIVVQQISRALAQQYTDRIGADPFRGRGMPDDTETDDIRAEMLPDPAVRRALDMLWPALTPQQLLADLFSSPELISSAAPQLSPAERRLLLREPGSGWACSDVPLLDEAMELLGEDERQARALADRERRVRIDYAQGVLDLAHGSRPTDLEVGEEPEMLTVSDVADATYLAERFEEPDYRSPAERAAADRTWTFGHVIVDEAQELSEMAWRLLMRRCPVRSMTIVGDLAQTCELGGASSWQRALAPYLDGRWQLEELTINYRMPAEIMAVAAGVLAHIDPELPVPRSVRQTGLVPWRYKVPRALLAERLAGMAASEARELGGRRLAVIVPGTRLHELGTAVAGAVPAATIGQGSQQDSQVVVLDTRQAKGLEFDVVLVAEPGQIVAESPRGLNDLYVALTRATQRLGVVHAGELPAALNKLQPAGPTPPDHRKVCASR